jgi:hypothetical protein
MADGDSNKAWLLTISFTAGTFILALFKYLSDEESNVVNKKIAIYKLKELEEASAAKAAKASDVASNSPSSDSQAPQVSSS